MAPSASDPWSIVKRLSREVQFRLSRSTPPDRAVGRRFVFVDRSSQDGRLDLWVCWEARRKRALLERGPPCAAESRNGGDAIQNNKRSVGARTKLYCSRVPRSD